jgi:hypothetical protein
VEAVAGYGESSVARGVRSAAMPPAVDDELPFEPPARVILAGR